MIPVADRAPGGVWAPDYVLDRAMANRPKVRGEHSPMGVYVCFDADGVPLYVGQTSGWFDRSLCHRDRSPWWPQVERVHIFAVRPERSRRAIERALIMALCPPHNQQCTPEYGRRVSRIIRATDDAKRQRNRAG